MGFGAPNFGKLKTAKEHHGHNFVSNSTQIRQEVWKVRLEILKLQVEILLGFLVNYEFHWAHFNKTHAYSATFDNGTLYRIS